MGNAIGEGRSERVARNLQKYQRPPRGSGLGKLYKKHSRKIIIGLVVLSVLLGTYGIFNLIRLAPGREDKQELVYETGDQPLEQKTTIYVDAPSGLNMRQEADAASKLLATIPNGTKLEASLLEGDWYRVTYEGKTGWINKKYVKTSANTDTPATANWTSYQGSQYGFSISHPGDWVSKDYGANQAARLQGYVGFGSQLSDQLNASSLPPVAVKVTSDPVATVHQSYLSKSNVVAADSTIGGVAGKLYTFTASSGVQMNAYVLNGSNYTYILEESGGYVGELVEMAKGFKLL